jgi:Ca-activated chloride channel family protein
MLAEMDGRVKFDIARDAVRSLVNDLPANCKVALRVYGHRRRAIEPNADEDTELIIPMAPFDKRKFNAVLDELRPRGKTPLALSMEEAARDLGRTTAQNPVTVLLLTDGGEDTLARRNPLKSASLLRNLKGIRFHVVGFDINQPEWTEQLLGIAEQGSGRYWPAARTADLERGIHTGVLGLPEQYLVLDSKGSEVTRVAFGQSTSLLEGKYSLKTVYGGTAVERDFSITAGSTTSVVLDALPELLVPSDSTAASATRPMQIPSKPTGEVTKHFCTQCGAELSHGARFCEKCGAKVTP